MTYLPTRSYTEGDPTGQRGSRTLPVCKLFAALLVSALLMVLFGLLYIVPGSARAEAAQEDNLTVIHTVGTQEGFCATTPTIAVPAGTTVYYCFTIVNDTPVTLTDHIFAMPLFGITRTFKSIIPPGEELAVDTGYLLTHSVFDQRLEWQVNTQNVSSPVSVLSRAENEDEYNYLGQATARVVVGTASTTLKQSVGTVENLCPESTAIAVNSGTKVYYCLTITDTGTLDFVRHEILAPQLGATFVYTPADPTAATQQLTAQLVRQNFQPNVLEKTVTGPFTNVMTVTSYTSDGIVAQSSASTTAVLGATSAVLTYTVGTVADSCATTPAVTVATGGTAYFCIKLKNTGTLPFERLSIDAPGLSLQTNLTRTVGVGEMVVLTHTVNSKLAKSITANENNSITVDAYTAEGIRVSTQGAVNVTVGALGISVAKYARSTPEGCVTTAPLTISSTTSQFFYCVVIRNTGTAPIEAFTVVEPGIANINFSFNYPLMAGQTITLTNDFLANTLKMGSFLGPFTTTSGLNNTMTVTARGANNATFPGTAAFQILLVIPTNTLVPSPTPSMTWTPTMTPIPTTTPTVPPTPTPTNVVVSILPSATSILGLDTVSTPIGGVATATAFGAVPDSPLPDSALATPTPPIDFFATEAASTAMAITATVLAAAQTAAMDATQAAIALTEQVSPTATAPPTHTVTPVPTATPTATPQPIAGNLPPDDRDRLPNETIAPDGVSAAEPFDGDYVSLIAATLATSTATLGWLWFLAGSIIFFAVAGMFAGLSFRQQERRRYRVFDDEQRANHPDDDLLFDDIFGITDEPLDPWPEPESGGADAQERKARRNDRTGQPTDAPNDDDYWPASLP